MICTRQLLGRTCEQRQTWARLSQANNFSFERTPLRTSAREHLGMAGNSASLCVTCSECFSSTSEGWAEYWALQPPIPDRIYGVQQQVVFITHVIFQTNCRIGLPAGVPGPCLSPGIITVILSFHNVSANIVPVVVNNTLGVMWLEWRRQRRVFMPLTLAAVYILAFCFTEIPKVLARNKTTEWEISVNNRNPPPVWGGIPVPV